MKIFIGTVTIHRTCLIPIPNCTIRNGNWPGNNRMPSPRASLAAWKSSTEHKWAMDLEDGEIKPLT